MRTILLVEDDATVAEVVSSYLQRAGFQARTIANGTDAAALLDVSGPDEFSLVMLDVMLPGVDGLALCRKLRALYPELPVIMLTALGEEDDRIAGLEVGADDYVTKPFSPRELVLRVESVLRRAASGTRLEPASTAVVLAAGPLRVEPSARRAFKNGDELALTVRELDLLIYLMEHPGVAFTRTELMQGVWGWTFGDHSTVTVHVRRLREKIEDDPKHPELIQTVWGVGYRMDAA
jgi:DNA-binding response OmpR family regulator